jgi:hypothetical protein
MAKLKREDLYSLEQYAQLRPQFRAQVMRHKKHRQLAIGPHATLSFEDRLTMQYQVQEMLRVERIFEAEGIDEEIAAYNPLIPDGTNWKATLMLEYPDMQERQRALAQLRGIEDRVWVRVADPGLQHAGTGFEPVSAIADEDLERENESKTSSVHFLRFELTPAMIAAVKRGAAVSMGIDHPHYRHEVSIPTSVRDALAADLND